MGSQKFFINDFSGGIISDLTKQSLNSFEMVEGLDIWSEPGKLLKNVPFKLTTYSLFADEITSFGYYVSEGKYFASDLSGNFYFSTGLNGWTLSVHTDTGSIDNRQFKEYQGYFFYCKTNDIGYFSGVTGTADYLSTTLGGSFVNSASNHIMVSYNEKLYISDGSVVAEIDGSSGSIGAWIFTRNKLLMENDENITAMVVFNGSIAIGTDQSNFYIWDGESEGATQEIKTGLGNISGMIEHQNTLFMIFNNNGDSPQYIYQYTGSDFTPILALAKNANGFDRYGGTFNQIFEYRDGLILQCITYDPAVGDVGCLYVLNKAPGTNYALTKYGKYGNSGNINGFFSRGTDLLLSYEDTTEKVLYNSTSGNISLGENLETLNYELLNPKGFKTLIKSIIIDSTDDGDCSVQYSFDNGTYTTAVTLDYNTTYRIDQRCSFFSIKLSTIDEGITGIRIY